MDSFAELVKLLRPVGVFWKTIEAKGAWGLRFAQNQDVNFGMVLKGECLLIRKGEAQQYIKAGDFLMQCRPASYVIGSQPDVAPTDAETLLARSKQRTLHLGVGSFGEVSILAGHFRFDSVNHDLLSVLLPRIVHIAANNACAKQIFSLLAFAAEEASFNRPGGTIIVQRAIEILLVEVLRDQAFFSPNGQNGMIAGLADPLLTVALKELHANPAAEWTVTRLAQTAGISRSVFAERFRQVVGATPIEYLLAWRMALAKESLTNSLDSMQEIASAVGYKSATSFSTAFSKRVGRTPKEFRKKHGRKSPLLP